MDTLPPSRDAHDEEVARVHRSVQHALHAQQQFGRGKLQRREVAQREQHALLLQGAFELALQRREPPSFERGGQAPQCERHARRGGVQAGPRAPRGFGLGEQHRARAGKQAQRGHASRLRDAVRRMQRGRCQVDPGAIGYYPGRRHPLSRHRVRPQHVHAAAGIPQVEAFQEQRRGGVRRACGDQARIPRRLLQVVQRDRSGGGKSTHGGRLDP